MEDIRCSPTPVERGKNTKLIRKLDNQMQNSAYMLGYDELFNGPRIDMNAQWKTIINKQSEPCVRNTIPIE